MLLWLLFLLRLSQAVATTKNIFLLAGQSNMAGRGGVVNNTVTGVTTWDGFVPPECRPNPSVLRLNAGLSWEEAAEPLHADIDYNKTNGVGPGMAFANAVSGKDPSLGLVGLVPCAIGGTNISQWGRGSFLYNQLVRRAQAAVLDGGSIRALLWYQGESDTKTREGAESYKGKLVKFFMDLGDDLHLPMLPIIQVAIASGPGEGAFVETVRKAQLGIGLPNVKTVDAKGLPLEMDGIHLTTLAQVQLGQFMSDSFLQSSSFLFPANVSRRTSSSSYMNYYAPTMRFSILITIFFWFSLTFI